MRQQLLEFYNEIEFFQKIKYYKQYMKNFLIGQMQNSIGNARETLSNLIQNISSSNKQQQELKFQDILQQTQQIGKQSQPKEQSLNVKLEQAIRNSSIAKTLYHEQQSQKIIEELAENSEILKEMEKQISYSNISNILELKAPGTKEQQKEQMCGILSKYSPSLFGGWTDRYCILTKNKFLYMEGKERNSEIAGVLNFNILSFSVQLRYSGQKIDSFEVKVDNGDKSFIFKGANPNVTFEWFDKIRQFIKDSDGKINNVTSLSNYHRFWRKQYITQKQFEKTAQTGDILLFRGKKTSAILQRTMTQQEYDHIGVVLLNAFDQILIFQANGGFGVGICPWKKFIKNKWFEDQQIVAIRHLKIKRTQPFLNEVTKFVQNNIGKGYKFSVKNYLMTRNSAVENQKSTFFCSSLVAKLYKNLGLLDPMVSSNRYMPYDFSDSQKLTLLKGKYGNVELEREKIIVFEIKQRNKIFQKNS